MNLVSDSYSDAVLTLTLDDIQVELLDGPHADLLEFCVQEHLHHGGGKVLTG